MKTNKQTNRELICTWGFYEAKKERFMDDDKNKQKNKQTNKQRQYSMIKRMEITLNSSQWNRRTVNEAKSSIVRFLETLLEV